MVDGMKFLEGKKLEKVDGRDGAGTD